MESLEHGTTLFCYVVKEAVKMVYRREKNESECPFWLEVA